MAMAIRIGINLSIYALNRIGVGVLPVEPSLKTEDGSFLLLESGGKILL
jgi:hypothetical protein